MQIKTTIRETVQQDITTEEKETHEEVITRKVPTAGEHLKLLSGREVAYITCLWNIGFLVSGNRGAEVHYHLCDENGNLMLDASQWRDSVSIHSPKAFLTDPTSVGLYACVADHIPGVNSDGTFHYTALVTRTVVKHHTEPKDMMVDKMVTLPNKGDTVYSVYGNPLTYMGFVPGLGFLAIAHLVDDLPARRFRVYQILCSYKGERIVDYTHTKVDLRNVDVNCAEDVRAQ